MLKLEWHAEEKRIMGCIVKRKGFSFLYKVAEFAKAKIMGLNKDELIALIYSLLEPNEELLIKAALKSDGNNII
jgi:hypothetical protein